MNSPFILEQVYPGSIKKVWDALTNEKKMRVWYFPQLIKFQPETGFKFVFTDDGSPYRKEWIVTKVEEGKLLAHSWTYIGYPGYSEVSFELSDEGDKTRLRLTHTGLDSFLDDPHFTRQRFEDGWKRITGSSLKRFLQQPPA